MKFSHMKLLILVASFLAIFHSARPASAAASFSIDDDIITCVRKLSQTNPRSWSLVMLKKSQGVVVYQNSSRGNESDPITNIGQVGTKLIAQHDLGTKETVTFDFANGNATWVEDAYPTNTQIYRTCQGFKTFDFDTVQKWFNSVVETPEWLDRVEY